MHLSLLKITAWGVHTSHSVDLCLLGTPGPLLDSDYKLTVITKTPRKAQQGPEVELHPSDFNENIFLIPVLIPLMLQECSGLMSPGMTPQQQLDFATDYLYNRWGLKIAKVWGLFRSMVNVQCTSQAV